MIELIDLVQIVVGIVVCTLLAVDILNMYKWRVHHEEYIKPRRWPYTTQYECPICKQQLERGDKVCPLCDQKFIWGVWRRHIDKDPED